MRLALRSRTESPRCKISPPGLGSAPRVGGAKFSLGLASAPRARGAKFPRGPGSAPITCGAKFLRAQLPHREPAVRNFYTHTTIHPKNHRSLPRTGIKISQTRHKRCPKSFQSTTMCAFAPKTPFIFTSRARNPRSVSTWQIVSFGKTQWGCSSLFCNFKLWQNLRSLTNTTKNGIKALRIPC